MKNTAYVLPPKLAEKVKRIKKELGLKDTGSVITKAIELLDISLGRKVVLTEKGKSTTYQIEDLEEYQQTFSIESNGNGD